MLARRLLNPYAFHERCVRGGAKGGLCFLLFCSGLAAAGQEREFEGKLAVDNLPVPDEANQLFYLQRDPDANTVVYQLNRVDGTVDADKPVNVYWIRYAEGGSREGLNFIQRSMAYGISHTPLGNGDFELRLAAYKNHPLRLVYDEKTGRHHVYTAINGRQAVLDRIFVRIEGGSVLRPGIRYFELTGRDPVTGAQVTERIEPTQ